MKFLISFLRFESPWNLAIKRSSAYWVLAPLVNGLETVSSISFAQYSILQLWRPNIGLFPRSFYGWFIWQWRLDQWSKEFVKYTSVPSFSSFIIQIICGAANCLASDVIISWPRTTRTARMMALIILQRRRSLGIMLGFSTDLIRT